MKVIVDDKIPYIKGVIEKIVDEVVYLPGSAFTNELVLDADALVIRTRTICNEKLLSGSKVKFIATATIGFDHIDTAYCEAAGISWQNAPGCNATSVAQYIMSVLILWQQYKAPLDMPISHFTIGVVGVGHVGSEIVSLANKMGLRVLQNDTPRADAEGTKDFVSLKQIAAECDIITFHVPLIKEGKYRTYHLADAAFFDSLEKKPLIINTSRGSVIDTSVLKHAIIDEKISDAVLDVWENEPNIDLELLDKVWIGTPHIAGYSADGKANATRMSLHALCHFFNLGENFNIAPLSPVNTNIFAASYDDALLQIYDPRRDSVSLKTHPEKFEYLRGNYPLRRERNAYNITIDNDIHTDK
jgi:erythronate-4-phosphate dehydrogenase